MPFFRNILHKITRRDLIMMLVMAAACAVLTLLELLPPTVQHQSGSKEKGEVVTVDNSGLISLGTVETGSQMLTVRMLSGSRKGEILNASNYLRAQMDLDKKFVPGDTILVGIPDGFDPAHDLANAQDHYRLNLMICLFALFALLLLIFGGVTGFNALLSFVFSCLVIWKIIIPLCLKGWSAIWISFGAVMLLSAVIIFLVAGLNRKGTTAFAGSAGGVLVASLMAWCFTNWFHINGAVMPYAPVLFNSGYSNLSLSDIYIGAVFISSSGAIMDLAMDIASAMHEVACKKADISRRELLCSGFQVGRSVVGTMTTTLLLAYSGGYLTLMMTFAAQGTSPVDFINNPHVASEMVKTLIGSFALVLVAPLTALIGAAVIPGSSRKISPKQ